MQGHCMAVCFFLPETGLFVFYIFAAVLLFGGGSAEINGWYLLFFTHLALTAKIALDMRTHGAEAYLFLLFICAVFVLVGLFMTLLTIGRARPKDYVEGASSDPPIRGEVRKQLNRTRRLVLGDVALIAVLAFFAQLRITWPAAIPHLFPVYRQQFRPGGPGSGPLYRWQWVSLREYTWLSGFLLPWASGGGMAAALGLSSYLVYWSRDVLLRLGA